MKDRDFKLLHFIVASNPGYNIDVISLDRPCSRLLADNYLRYLERIDFYFHNIKFNISDLVIKYSNNSIIRFLDFENEDNIRGTHRDVLFIRESSNINEDIFNQLSSRTKKLIIKQKNN